MKAHEHVWIGERDMNAPNPTLQHRCSVCSVVYDESQHGPAYASVTETEQSAPSQGTANPVEVQTWSLPTRFGPGASAPSDHDGGSS